MHRAIEQSICDSWASCQLSCRHCFHTSKQQWTCSKICLWTDSYILLYGSKSSTEAKVPWNEISFNSRSWGAKVPRSEKSSWSLAPWKRKFHRNVSSVCGLFCSLELKSSGMKSLSFSLDAMYIHCVSNKTRQLWRTITTTQFSRFN